MVRDNGRGGLLRLQQEAGRQAHPDGLLRFEQLEQLGLVFQVGARGLTNRIARATVLLVESIADFWRVLAHYA